MLNRRTFLWGSAGFALPAIKSVAAGESSGIIMTVNGPIAPSEMGITLPHEHVLVDFIGADQVSPSRYNIDDAFQKALPFLQQVRGLGCRTLVECTPAYIGRDVKLCRRLSVHSGLHMLTNTGYYGAAKDKFVPPHAYQESADQLAARWVREWNQGIEGTPIRPGFIKIGVDKGPLSDIDRKLVTAAARASLATGLTIASHNGDTQSGQEQIQLVMKEGLRLSKLIIVHAQNDWNLQRRIQWAAQGVWIEIDNLNTSNVSEILPWIISMKHAGQLKRVLLSHDAGWYHVGQPGGGTFRDYNTLFTHFVPALKGAGLTQDDIDQVLVNNPRDAFLVG